MLASKLRHEWAKQNRQAAQTNRKSLNMSGGGNWLKPSRFAFRSLASASIQLFVGVKPKSSPSFQSLRCFVSSSSKNPRALPAERRIAFLTGAERSKKARICWFIPNTISLSIPWLMTWKNPRLLQASTTCVECTMTVTLGPYFTQSQKVHLIYHRLITGSWRWRIT